MGGRRGAAAATGDRRCATTCAGTSRRVAVRAARCAASRTARRRRAAAATTRATGAAAAGGARARAAATGTATAGAAAATTRARARAAGAAAAAATRARPFPLPAPISFYDHHDPSPRSLLFGLSGGKVVGDFFVITHVAGDSLVAATSSRRARVGGAAASTPDPVGFACPRRLGGLLRSSRLFLVCRETLARHLRKSSRTRRSPYAATSDSET